MDTGWNKLLKPWEIIRIRISGETSWVTDVIYRVRPERNEVDVGLEPSTMSMTLPAGTRVLVRYVTEEGDLNLQGQVVSVSNGFPRCMTLRIRDEAYVVTQRESLRYEVDLSAIVKPSSSHEHGVFVNIRDISVSGMSFTSHKEISYLFTHPSMQTESEQPMYSEIFVRPDKILSVQGYLVRQLGSDGLIQYGMRFLSDGNKRLLLFLYTLEDELQAIRKKHLHVHASWCEVERAEGT